jgi:alkyl sulfatase BDS1-like metallo-beta-lactamase superfamily hydrolase
MSLGKCFLFSLIFLLCGALLSSPVAGEGRSKMITPGVYAITDLGFSNCGFIVTDEGVIVVDTLLIPAFAGEMVKEIKAVTDKPVKYVINTH